MHINTPYLQLKPYLTKAKEEIDLEFYHNQIPSTAFFNTTIHANYKHKLSHWEIWLQNLDTSHTTIYFKGDPFFSHHLFFTMIFESLLQYKQTQKNHLVLHSSAVSNNNKSYAFSGDACVGKTSILLHFLKEGYQYLADDQTMIDAKTLNILPYTLPVGINLKLAIKTHITLTAKNKLFLFLQTLINSLFFNYSHLTTNIPLENLHFSGKKTTLGKPTKLHKIFILTTGSLSIKKLTHNEATFALWKNKIGSRSKLPALIYYAEEFKKQNPDFLLRKNFQFLLTELTKKIPIYQVSYNKTQLSEAIKLIKQEIEND